MHLCEGNRLRRHAAIVFEIGFGCPLCAALQKIETLKEALDELRHSVTLDTD